MTQQTMNAKGGTDLRSPRTSPVLSADELRRIAHTVLHAGTAPVTRVFVDHVATGVTRVAENRVRLTNSGNALKILVSTQLGERWRSIIFNQIDDNTIREAVAWVERIGREMPGESALSPNVLPILPRHYGPNTVWHDETAWAMAEERHTIVPTLLKPLLDDRLRTAAFIGVYARAKLYADKQGLFVLGQETDTELTVTGWSPADSGVLGSPGWAGQAARNWTTLDPTKVGTEAARLTKLASNAVAYEPGRRLTILGRPAVAQMVRAIGRDFDAYATHIGQTPLSGISIGQKVWDERMSLSSNPNDAEGGYLPFDDSGYPQVAMPWITNGQLSNLAYNVSYAAERGITVPNDAPTSLRLQASGTLLAIDEMIANAPLAVYVNRVANIQTVHSRSGLLTGVTHGGCFLVRNGKIEKSIKDFRFVESVYFILNKLVAVGSSERTAMGYAPWHGEWPVAPTIVPPLMVRDFNFVSLAESV